MAIKRMPIGQFVNELVKAKDRKDGYIMGSKGQNPKKWSKSSWYFTQYKDRDKYSAKQEAKALYWRENAERVWDCNGLAEGIYEDFSGLNINTDTEGKARFNYARWCSIKGTGNIPTKYRVPGVAIFWGTKSSNIHHVAYLWKPLDANKPEGNWYIIEAKGVLDGVVVSKLNSRKPNFWGVMDKYFDYGDMNTTVPAPAPTLRTLKKGMKGDDVELMQDQLMGLGYDMGSYGSDGDFGSTTLKAVKLFQKNEKLTADGHYGPLSREAMSKAMAKYPVSGKFLKLTKKCTIYVADNFGSTKLGTCSKNRVLSLREVEASNGWYKIMLNGKPGFVYKDYIKLI